MWRYGGRWSRTLTLSGLCVSLAGPALAGEPAPAFVKEWGSQGSGPGQFIQPIGIACTSSGDVYVADTGNERVQRFTSEGVFVQEWGERCAVSGEPPCTLDPDGDGPLEVGDGLFAEPAGLVWAPNGNLLVGEFQNFRVQEFTPEGVFVGKMGGLGVLSSVLHIAADSAGRVFVTYKVDAGIRVMEGGVVTATWIAPGGNAAGMALDSQGHLYVANSQLDVVHVFDSHGTIVGTLGQPGIGEGQFDTPVFLAVDGADNLYVGDHDNHRIQKFSASGEFLTQWGSEGTGPGQFAQISGVCVDGSGNVYVLDWSLNRVQKFAPPVPVERVTWGRVKAGRE